MTEDRFYQLVSRQLSGEITAAETAELEALLQQNTQLEQIYQSLFSVAIPFTDDDLLEGEQAYATHAVRMQLSGAMENTTSDTPLAPQHSRRVIRRSLLAAASLCAVLGISVVFYLAHHRTATPVRQQREIATVKGARSTVKLPDGSTVWLNADSKISYPDNFNGRTREIQLTGEAYFDIAKDKERPFIIHTNMIDVRVLGTAFNIRSYPEEKTTVTSLIRGMVEVTLRNQADKKIILSPSEKLSVTNTRVLPAVQPASTTDSTAAAGTTTDADQPLLTLGHIRHRNDTGEGASLETCWISDKLAFDGDTFDVVAADIERWYNVKVVFKNGQLKNMRFTAVFEHKSLTEILEALRLSGNFTYTINAGIVTIL